MPCLVGSAPNLCNNSASEVEALKGSEGNLIGSKGNSIGSEGNLMGSLSICWGLLLILMCIWS